MNDTEILDWIQENVTEINEDVRERLTVTWLDKSGIPRTTEGTALRDCIRIAAADIRSGSRHLEKTHAG